MQMSDIKALLRLGQGFVKALLRLGQGSVKALFRTYKGGTQDVLISITA
jgi:hypothetical protein